MLQFEASKDAFCTADCKKYFTIFLYIVAIIFGFCILVGIGYGLETAAVHAQIVNNNNTRCVLQNDDTIQDKIIGILILCPFAAMTLVLAILIVVVIGVGIYYYFIKKRCGNKEIEV